MRIDKNLIFDSFYYYHHFLWFSHFLSNADKFMSLIYDLFYYILNYSLFVLFFDYEQYKLTLCLTLFVKLRISQSISRKITWSMPPSFLVFEYYFFFMRMV